ncbi:microfibril-associated glycoprotein 4-like [Denticeps clupeoides]|uniref:Fibrinogen C-terminal domain-containing protein n=1 Tax=Denticeps clupeoides TaxID=299321 RepID=A0AAY4AMD6_9TELE|nr:microfibril-associated glycoprotein 4-like [Denticeps clupeoides]
MAIFLGFCFLALVSPLLCHVHLPIDCDDVYNNGSTSSGVYTIYPVGLDAPIQVYCDMGCPADESTFDGHWMVIQRRMNGTVNFYRPWNDYKDGFGDLEGEYWLGLENMFLITWSAKYELKVDMEDFEHSKVYAQYSSFSVDSETNGYKLHADGFINGGAGDSLYFHNGMNFSTFDNDQDMSTYYYWYNYYNYYYYGYNNNCAELQEGGFWYQNCFTASPNGVYKWGANTESNGVIWSTWKGNNYSLKKMVMKIKRVSLSEIEE